MNGFHKTKTPSPPYGIKNSFKNTFPLDKKYFSLAEVSEKWKIFKIFNIAPNKTILFLLDRKFVSSSQNEEFVKKTFPWEILFSLPGIFDKCKNGFSVARKTVSTRSNEVFL